MATYGIRLKQLRKENGLIQLDIAEHLGISLRSFRSYENEEREPNYHVLMKLAKFYDCTTDYILGLSNEKQHKTIKLEYKSK